MEVIYFPFISFPSFPFLSFPFLSCPLFSFHISKHIHSDPLYGHPIINFILNVFIQAFVIIKWEIQWLITWQMLVYLVMCIFGRIVYLLMENILKRLYKKIWGCKSIDFLSCYIPIFFVIWFSFFNRIFTFT